jgi:hypothetical protein
VRDVLFQTQIFGHFQDLGIAIVHESDALFRGYVLGLHEPPQVRIEVFLDFMDKLLTQEELLFPGARGGVADIVIPPQAHPLAQQHQFFLPMLADNLGRYIR